MHAVRRTTAALTAALLGAALLGATTAPARAAAPSVDLEPATLERGADVAVAHVEGDELVVGDRRVDLPGARAFLLGPSGDGHVVGTTSENGLRNRRIVRVAADGTVSTLLTRVSPFEVVLAEDGRRLAYVAPGTRRASTARVWSATTGELLATTSLRDYPSVVAVKGARVLLSTWERGVFWWRTGSGRTTPVVDRPAGRASITRDLLATYTGDPYQGGCTVVSRLSRPGRTLWQSCRERVDAFSPDGTRMATIDILSDGIGPGRVVQREVDGTALAAYSTYWFGTFTWESPGVMLLETHGRRQTATVRCDLADCENATDPVRTADPRSPAPGRLLTRGLTHPGR